MTEALATTQTTEALMQQVVDSKITRQELLDLIIARVDDDLRHEQEKLQAERDALKSDEHIRLIDAQRLMRADPENVSVSVETGWGGEQDHLVMRLRVARSHLPEGYHAAKKRRAELDTAIGAIVAKRRRLSDSRKQARVAMIHRSLESTPEGRKVSKAIDGLKAHIAAEMLGEAQ